ncbi:hypothetical protein L6452_17946 [Arctium lappa]|uniref:Uncharacterized protein n=1 Tax=Arctium lappa TaxID=4217 RepID=A0ACB9C4U3_ARCLA|nr:hypothetical protein L6452_17946 [Arctium lappa]
MSLFVFVLVPPCHSMVVLGRHLSSSTLWPKWLHIVAPGYARRWSTFSSQGPKRRCSLGRSWHYGVGTGSYRGSMLLSPIRATARCRWMLLHVPRVYANGHLFVSRLHVVA